MESVKKTAIILRRDAKPRPVVSRFEPAAAPFFALKKTLKDKRDKRVKELEK